MTGGLSVTIVGADELQRRLNRMRTRANVEVRKIITTRALIIQTEIKRKLSQPGTGNKYRRGSRWHTASAPGSAPAVDTGRYRDSIALMFFRGGMAAEIGTNLKPYPGYLEPPPIGDSRGLSDRPAITPVWEEQQGAYIIDVAAAVRLLPKG